MYTTYKLELPNGFKYYSDFVSEPTQQDKQEVLRKLQINAEDTLRGGYIPPRRSKRNATNYVEGEKEEFYTRHITDLLAIPRSNFDYDNAAPVSLRTKLSPLRSVSAKTWWLSNKYGNENVRPLVIKDRDTILYRDPNAKNSKWRFYDHMDTELADFAELGSEIPPIVAGTVVGLKTFAAASPAVTPVGAVIPASAAAAVTEGAVGAGQDALARKALGIPEDVDDEYLQRRINEAKLNFGMGVALPIVGKIPFKRFVGVMSTDPAVAGTREFPIGAKQAMEMAGEKPIGYQLKGTKSLNRLTEIAGKFPDSAAAELLASVRTALNAKVMGEFGVKELSPEGFQDILSRSASQISRKYELDEQRFKDAIQTLILDQRQVRDEAGKLVSSEVREKANADAIKMFQTQLNQKVKNIVGKDVSTEATGLSVKNDLINNYVKTEAIGSNMYDQAYTLLQNVRVPAQSLATILDRSKRLAILSADDEVISTLAPAGRTASGRAVNSLQDILDEDITFKQLNEFTQQIRKKAGFGAKDTTPDQATYRQLSRELEELKETILDLPTTPASGKEAFNNANEFFKSEVKPFRENVIRKHIMPPEGANYGEAIKLAKAGQDFTSALPDLKTYLVGGTQLAKNALSSPSDLRAFLRVTGNSFESRQKLRLLWLNKKGLIAGRDIPVDAVKLSKEDKDIVAELWDKNVKGFNQRLDIFKQLEKFADTKDGYIKGLSAKTVNEILSESTTRTNKELRELGKQELLERENLTNLQNEKFFKMMGRGEIPIPENSATFDTFSEKLLTVSSPADFKAVVDQFRELGAEAEQSLILSVLQTMVTKASRRPDLVQFDSLNQAMWSPIELRKILNANKTNLIELLGEGRYKNLVDLNDAVDRVSVFPKYEGGIDELEIRLNVSMSGRTSGFIPNIYGASKDRLTKLLIWNQIKNPINFKRMVSPEDYERLNRETIKNIFIGGQAIQIASEAETDPDFRLMMSEILSSLEEEDIYDIPEVQPAPQPVQ